MMIDEETKKVMICPFRKGEYCSEYCACLARTPQHSYEKYYCGVQQYNKDSTRILVKDKN